MVIYRNVAECCLYGHMLFFVGGLQAICLQQKHTSWFVLGVQRAVYSMNTDYSLFSAYKLLLIRGANCCLQEGYRQLFTTRAQIIVCF